MFKERMTNAKTIKMLEDEITYLREMMKHAQRMKETDPENRLRHQAQYENYAIRLHQTERIGYLVKGIR